MKNNEIPRRNRLDLNTPAELAIHNAIQEVEKAGADERLTEAVILLAKAKDCIADFIDGIKQESHSDQMIDRMNEEQDPTGDFDIVITPPKGETFRYKLVPLIDQADDEEPKHPTSWRDFTMTDKVETPDKAIIEDVEARDECANNIWDGYTNEEKHIYTLGFNHCFEWYRDRLSSLQSHKISDEKVGDEQIEKFYPNECPPMMFETKYANYFKMLGAKAMRDGLISE
jgi:hypothetical protein